jgi:hypothetical protein
MRAVEDTGISILLAGCTGLTRTHPDIQAGSYRARGEARTTIQTMNRQDLEAGTGFTAYFRARLPYMEAAVQMAARQERLSTLCSKTQAYCRRLA